MRTRCSALYKTGLFYFGAVLTVFVASVLLLNAWAHFLRLFLTKIWPVIFWGFSVHPSYFPQRGSQTVPGVSSVSFGVGRFPGWASNLWGCYVHTWGAEMSDWLLDLCDPPCCHEPGLRSAQGSLLSSFLSFRRVLSTFHNKTFALNLWWHQSQPRGFFEVWERLH